MHLLSTSSHHGPPLEQVKFWLLKNFLSPAFIGELPTLAAAAGFEYGLVQYQWPSWLHKQTNKSFADTMCAAGSASRHMAAPLRALACAMPAARRR